MRVTAIRVGADLWRVLDAEAARVGVSVSQYVREAALARASAAAAARGEDLHELLAQARPRVSQLAAVPVPSKHERYRSRSERARARAEKARARAEEVVSDAQAVTAQAQLATRRRAARAAVFDR